MNVKMELHQFDSSEMEIDTMFGLAFDLDTTMLEEVYKVPRQTVYSAIRSKLGKLGFAHVQYSVYFYTEETNAFDFARLVDGLFSTFKYARAINDMQIFEVKNWSTATTAILERHEEAEELQKPMWP